jgi:CubicO group peptidase (beta-lactamase class C family)
MREQRNPAWLVVMLAAVGLLLAIPALWVIVSLTARPLHPDPAKVPTVSHSAPKSPGAAEKARQVALAHLMQENLPGLSVAAGAGGEIVWAEGFGFADLRSSVPVTPDHRFRIGTASTALTSAAAGLLLEKGTLKLDDEIQKYVPAFPKKQWPVTLRELMGHTAGVVSEGGEPLFTKHCERSGDALQYFAEKPLAFQPGTEHRYSSLGWALVSMAIEATADQPFLKFMREQIFDPAEMRHTMADAAGEVDDDFPPINMIRELIYDPRAARNRAAEPSMKPGHDRVTSYFTRFRQDPNYGLHLMRPLDYSCYSGASVFASTPSDLVRFGMAMQEGKLLRPDTVRLLQTSQRLASGKETGYGLGWYVRTVTLAGKETLVTGHDGDSLGGVVASLITLPDYGFVVAVTSNISYSGTFPLAVKIAEIFAEQRKTGSQ